MRAHEPGPPLARRDDTSEVIHGVTVKDPYRWLEDPDSSETKSWLKSMHVYSRRKLDALPGRDRLSQRLTDLSYVESVTPPRRRGERYFFSQRKKKQEKHVFYWRQGPDGKKTLLVDPNTMSDDGSTSLKGVWPSWDGRWAAYKISENNADEATMFVKNVATGKVSLIDTIPGVKYTDADWDPKSRGFYYTRLPIDPSIPTKERPGHAAAYYHRLGTKFSTDKLVHPKLGDPKVFLSTQISRDGHYLFLYKFYGWAKNDVFYKDLRKHKTWQPLAVGLNAKFFVYAWKNRFYIHTNYQAPRFRLLRAEPTHVAKDAWTEIVPQRSRAVLDEFSVIGGQLSLRYLDKASSRLEIVTLEGKAMRRIELPLIGTVRGPYGLPEHDTAYYGFSSYIWPSIIYRTSIKKGGRDLYFSLSVPIKSDPYQVEQVSYLSKDGTAVTMFIISRKNLQKNGATPFLLSGYGGFNVKKTPVFSATRFAFLEKGGAVAIPNLRGGGEYGDTWHRAGMLTRKQNVFDDFIAAAQFLIKKGYTQSDRLAIMGGSNGGLLVGAAMTQRPELFRAVVCAVPLLDMVRYHLFGSGQTWIGEYGSADDPDQFAALLAYSPYHHLRPRNDYPSILILSADSDDRVDPLHARKFVAALRYAQKGVREKKQPQKGRGRVLLRVESKSGHGGGDMVKKRVARLVDIYSFLFDELGMRDPS